MKNTILILIILIATLNFSFSQLQLEVAGNAKIVGKLETYVHENDTTTIVLGKNAGSKLNMANRQKNVFIGNMAGENSTIGYKNVYIGYEAGKLNDSGIGNIFIGDEAGKSSTDARANVFLGSRAGKDNINGVQNTYIGHQAGIRAMGSYNVFLGVSAGQQSTGIQNVMLGAFAGLFNDSGNENVLVGTNAGKLNRDGNENTFIGKDAGLNSNDSQDNTFVGNDAGEASTSGSDNTYIGQGAGFLSTTGSRNTFLGELCGHDNTTGSDLTLVGQNINNFGGTNSNAFAIGNNATIPHSHVGVVGNVSTQEIMGYVNWGTVSDGRIKKRVKEDVKGLDFVMQLRPVSYTIDAEKLANALQPEPIRLDGEEDFELSPIYQEALRKKSRIRYTGFIAQEVAAAAKKSDFNFSGVVPPKNDHDHYSIRYAEFVMPLVKATQEQQNLIKTQEQEIIQLNTQLAAVNNELHNLRDLVEQSLKKTTTDVSLNNNITTSPIDLAFLSQNQPNPCYGETLIQYSIPKEVRTAFIQIITINGRVVQQLPIESRGKGQLLVKTDFLTNINYFYSLVLDGKIVETKSMIVVQAATNP